MTELLIIKPSSLGDIVHGLQVATSLKAQCEGLRISWVVREIFAPIVRALRETGYAGWIAMEPFVYEPDGPTCAARMIGYVAALLEPSA